MIDNAPPPLNYAAPSRFFRGTYDCGTLHTLFGSIMLLACGIGVGWVGWVKTPAFLSLAERVYALAVLGLVAAACMAGGAYLGWAWFTGLVNVVEINVEGIADGRRFWRWERIGLVGGVLQNDGVVPAFRLTQGWLFRQVNCDPMPREAFDQLMINLKAFLLKSFPNVKVDPKPVVQN
jgi:hypothetical protein